MTCIIILAAGSSTRLGRAKQTLPYQGSSLLNHTIKVALDSNIGPVFVVLGANEKEVSANMETDAAKVLLNKDYHEGIASSIKTGLNYVLKNYSDCDNIILMVCDQPYVDEQILKNLVNEKNNSGKPLVACTYKDTIGVPALFDKRFFNELLFLQGEEGGKKVLQNNQDSVATVSFPLGEIDIDTASDFDTLISK